MVWFQFRIQLADAQSTWDWIGDDMPKHIAAWELLAQFALSYCIESHLPKSRAIRLLITVQQMQHRLKD